MTKANIVDTVVAKTGLKKKDAEAAYTAIFASISEALENGEKVQINGFGTFDVKARAARTGRNPQTGKEITIAASKVVHFSAGKALKDTVNK